MAKDKERTINPAQAQRKSEKLKALKKSKAEQQARRNEKLARRNPARIERQISDLKAIQESGQTLKPHEKQRLEGLERDLKGVLKAREALGDAAPKFEARDEATALGKRQRPGYGRPRKHEDSSDTDEGVRNIPMPRDKSPPIPREYWQRQRERREAREREEGRAPDTSLPPRPVAAVVQSKAVYEAAPEIRDLRKEATTRFVPAAVRQKQQTITGAGGRLLEPEEMDRLEQAGYLPKQQSPAQGQTGASDATAASFDADLEALHSLNQATVEEVEDEEL